MTDEDLQAQISGVDMSDPAQSALLKRLEAERSRRDRMVQLQALRLGNSPRRGHAAIPLEEKESTS
jgi:regulator of protease activity HflC (stomatin/prohibitin superfamily)